MTFFVWVPLDFLQDIRLNQGNDNNWYFCGCQLSLEGLNEFFFPKSDLTQFCVIVGTQLSLLRMNFVRLNCPLTKWYVSPNDGIQCQMSQTFKQPKMMVKWHVSQGKCKYWQKKEQFLGMRIQEIQLKQSWI